MVDAWCVCERQIVDVMTAPILEVFEIRGAWRKHRIVLLESLHEPRRKVRWIPWIVGEVVDTQRTKPADFSQGVSIDRCQSGRHHELWTLVSACIHPRPAEVTEPVGTMTSEAPIEDPRQPIPGEGCARIHMGDRICEVSGRRQ